MATATAAGQVLQSHIPHLMKLLDRLWADWELFGTALGIPTKVLKKIKSNPEKPSCEANLLAVIQYLEKIPFEKRTWRMIHTSVISLERIDIAQQIARDHNLDEHLPHSDSGNLMCETILEAVKDVGAEWKMFGTFLGTFTDPTTNAVSCNVVSYNQLNQIQQNLTCQTCMLATLQHWIASELEKATITKLIAVIRGPIIDNEALAQDLENSQIIKELFGFGSCNASTPTCSLKKVDGVCKVFYEYTGGNRWKAIILVCKRDMLQRYAKAYADYEEGGPTVDVSFDADTIKYEVSSEKPLGWFIEVTKNEIKKADVISGKGPTIELNIIGDAGGSPPLHLPVVLHGATCSDTIVIERQSVVTASNGTNGTKEAIKC